MRIRNRNKRPTSPNPTKMSADEASPEYTNEHLRLGMQAREAAQRSARKHRAETTENQNSANQNSENQKAENNKTERLRALEKHPANRNTAADASGDTGGQSGPDPGSLYCFTCHTLLPMSARFCSLCGARQHNDEPTSTTSPTSMKVGDGEAIIQLSNITGPVTISHVEGVSTQWEQTTGEPSSSQLEANASGQSSDDEETANQDGSIDNADDDKGFLPSTTALITSGAAMATGLGVLATSLRQIMRPLMSLNGLGSLPLTPRSMIAALAAIIGTTLVGSSVAAFVAFRRRTFGKSKTAKTSPLEEAPEPSESASEPASQPASEITSTTETDELLLNPKPLPSPGESEH